MFGVPVGGSRDSAETTGFFGRIARLLRRRRSVRRERFSEGATGRAGGQGERRDGGEQSRDAPAEAPTDLRQPRPARSGEQGAIGLKFISEASLAVTLLEEIRPLWRAHRGEIVDVELAVVAEASFGIAAHLVPLLRTGRRDDGGQRGFHDSAILRQHRPDFGDAIACEVALLKEVRAAHADRVH